MDKAHEQIAHAGPVPGLVEVGILAVQDRFLEGPLTNIVIKRGSGLTKEQRQLVPVLEHVADRLAQAAVGLDKTASETIAIVGDLFESKKDLEEDSLWRSFSEFPEEHLKNREKILEIADFIIPGHGDMFPVKKKAKRFERQVNAIRISVPYHDNDGALFEKERIKLVEDLFTILFGGFQVDEGRGEWKNEDGKIYPAEKEGHYTIELPAKPDKSQIEMIEKLLRQWLNQKEIYLRLTELKK